MTKISKTVGKHNKHNMEDKLLMYYYKAIEYFEKNKNRVYTALTVLVVIIAVIFIYFRNESQKNETAALELAKVKQIYAADMFAMAINGDSLGMTKGLAYIVNEYGSTESGQTAKLMLANSYYNLRDFENADKFFKAYSGKNEMFKAAALAGIAAVCESKGDWINAAKNYENASRVSKNVPNNDEYMFNSIRSYFNAKDNDNLKKSIKAFKTEFPKSKYLNMISRYDIGDQS
jgi:outer membrane protein assembly factor BamD (BamD/ComL family)